jgi:hypothetical protein
MDSKEWLQGALRAAGINQRVDYSDCLIDAIGPLVELPNYRRYREHFTRHLYQCYEELYQPDIEQAIHFQAAADLYAYFAVSNSLSRKRSHHALAEYKKKTAAEKQPQH